MYGKFSLDLLNVRNFKPQHTTKNLNDRKKGDHQPLPVQGRHRVSIALMCTSPSPCSAVGRREQLKLDKNNYH